jgi:hypothetical protein
LPVHSIVGITKLQSRIPGGGQGSVTLKEARAGRDPHELDQGVQAFVTGDGLTRDMEPVD